MSKEEKKQQKAQKKLQKAEEKQQKREARSVYREQKGNKDREIKWGKLDNTAHLFPVIAGEGMTNVYRVAIILKEEIQQDLLQQALDMVLPKFSVFNCRLRQGMFWYYFEENGKKSPTVHEEHTYPCRYIDEHRNRSYLFRVTYYGCRIKSGSISFPDRWQWCIKFLKGADVSVSASVPSGAWRTVWKPTPQGHFTEYRRQLFAELQKEPF